MPTRPTVVDADEADGEEADAADPTVEVPLLQVPDAVPAKPPPSNTDVETVVSPLEIPEPEDDPASVLDTDGLLTPDVPEPFMPGVTMPLPEPNDVCGTEPPMPQPLLVMVAPEFEPKGETPDVAGLTPGEPSSNAPIGMRVGGTGFAEPIPSGDVVPSGGSPGVS